jgi:Tfp pilus assembly protein PilV
MLANLHGRRQAGFTLIEALVALVVMAFGMFAIAGFQITMSRNSEVAKQRSEAVRLGQLKLEELRSFETVTSDGVGGLYDYVSDVVGGNDTVLPTGANAYASNTSYARTWTLTRSDGVTAAAGTDAEKWINMLVTWTDRTGATQEVRLRSIISRSDPVDLGTLFTGPGGVKTRTPKNRNINIPYPAVDLAGKKSAFSPPGSGLTFVFDNGTGEVIGYCNFALTAGATVDLETDDGDGVDTGCTAERGFLLSGYVHFLNSNPSGTERNQDNAVTNPNNTTRDLTIGVDFTFSSAPAGFVAPSCFVQRQKVARIGSIPDPRDIQTAARSGGVVTINTQGNHGFAVGDIVSINGVTGGAFDGVFTITAKTTGTFTYSDARTNASSTGGQVTIVQELIIAETATIASQYNDITSRFVAYTCIVRPYSEDGANPTVLTWSGQPRVQGSVPIGTASRVVAAGTNDDVVTIVTSSPHQFITGQSVTISGLADFNGNFVVTVVNDTTFTYTFEGSLTLGVPVSTSYATPGSGSSTWALGATNDSSVSTTSKICRFSGDYKTDNAISNTEHPRTYRRVSGALDNQNYLVVPHSLSCPTDTQPDPVNSDDYLNTHTLLHQTTITGGKPYGGELSQSTQWGSTANSGEQGTETTFPMF